MVLLISKLGAAESQLIEAVKLFFEERDPISIHTLASAASQIVQDHFNEQDAQKYQLFLHHDYPSPEDRKRIHDDKRRVANFLKHADRDRNAKLEFNPKDTETDIADAIRCLGILKGIKYAMSIPELHAFDLWFFIQSRAQNMHLPIKNEELYEIFKDRKKAGYLEVIETFRKNPEIAESMELQNETN